MNLAQCEHYKFNRSLFRRENFEFVENLNHDMRFILMQKNFGQMLRNEPK